MIEVVVYEDGEEVERVDLEAAKYMVLTAEGWDAAVQVYPKSGTAQVWIKREPDEPSRGRVG